MGIYINESNWVQLIMARRFYHYYCNLNFTLYSNFTRILNNDNIFKLGHHFVEMNELRNILNRSNDKSLVLDGASWYETISTLSMVCRIKMLSKSKTTHVYITFTSIMWSQYYKAGLENLKIYHLRIKRKWYFNI